MVADRPRPILILIASPKAFVRVATVTIILALAPAIAWTAELPLTAAVDNLANQMAGGVQDGRVLRVAVIDFPDVEATTNSLSRFVRERLITRLSSWTTKFRVVERRRFDAVLTELRLGVSDLVDPASAARVGQILGAENIIVGTIADLGSRIEMDAHLIDVQTASVVSSSSVSVRKDDSVQRMLRSGRSTDTGQSPLGEGRQGQAFTTRGYSVTVESAEVLDKTLRLQLSYTCLKDRPCHLNPKLSGFGGTYLVDSRGFRYRLRAMSFSGKAIVTIPSKVTVRHWLVFEAPPTSSGPVHLVVGWSLGHFQVKNLQLTSRN